MTKRAMSSVRSAPLPFVAAMIFGALVLPAHAQGTAEQREACAPDAIRLCSDTIPDIPKTTACMKAHAAELSPHCHAVFAAAAENPAAAEPREPRRKRIARTPPGPDQRYEREPPPQRRVARAVPLPDDDEEPMPPQDRGEPRDRDDYAYGDDVERARAVIGHLCESDMIDPRTCDVTERALDMAR